MGMQDEEDITALLHPWLQGMVDPAYACYLNFLLLSAIFAFMALVTSNRGCVSTWCF
jgi:hypothetical protein